MLRSLLLWCAFAAFGCAGGRAEVVSRTLVDRQTEDHDCRPAVITAKVELAWPATTLRFNRLTRCQRMAIDRWETVQRSDPSDAARAVTGVVGAVLGAGGTYLIATNSGAFQPASPTSPGVSALGSIAAIGIAIGGSLAGGLASQGLLALYEKVGESKQIELAPTNLGEVERDSQPVEGVFEGHPTQHARVVLQGADVLKLSPAALRLDETPVELPPSQLQMLLAAQACARTLLHPASPQSLTAPQLAAAYRNAKECFEAGVAQAEPAYSRLLVERARRSPPSVLSAP